MADTVNWRERLAELPHLTRIEEWDGSINIEDLPPKKRKIFLRNYAIVTAVLVGEKLQVVATRHGVSNATLTYLLNRALGGDKAAAPALLRALVPNTQIKSSHRRAPLPSLTKPGGTRDAFQGLLIAAPGLKARLDEALLADLKDNPRGQNLTARLLQKLGLAHLREQGWTSERYPFTTQSLAYRGFNHYFKQFRRAQQLKKTRRHYSAAVRLTCATRRPLSEIQIDEQVYDMQVSFIVQARHHTTKLRLARPTLILVVDAESSCILAYRLIFEGDADQYDILQTLKAIYTSNTHIQDHSPFKKEYLENAGLPATRIDQFQQYAISEIRMDNAMSHHAETVVQFMARMGCTVNHGHGRTPKDRALVERIIKMSAALAHRFKSTTGRNVVDPRKEHRKNRKRPPALTYEQLVQCVDVAVANYNATVRSTLENDTPLQELQRSLEQKPHRTLPPHVQRQVCHPEIWQTATVRWYGKASGTPHITFLELRYRGEALSNPQLVDKEVRIGFDPDDIRTLTVYSLQGEKLGKIQCPLSLRYQPFSLKVRKLYMQTAKTKTLANNDPILGLFDALAQEKHKPKTASKLARLITDTKRGDPVAHNQETDGHPPSTAPADRVKAPKRHVPRWTPEFSGIQLNDDYDEEM